MLNRIEKRKLDLDKQDIVYSVSELNRMVQTLLENAFLPIWIEGEISNFACPSSGHWYFSLKDKMAQVRCAFFHRRSRYKTLTPKDGMQVLVRAKVSLYPTRGEFQLIVDQLTLAGEGALRQAFDKLKAQLTAEGLFDNRHKKSIPKFPKTIGVITSESGAVLRDICAILKKRFTAISVIIYPTLVQGKIAAAQIIRQIQQANLRKECDLLILARGGGSLEDLWSFNEENVARAVFKSKLPIISAIGHETDFTITDFVADCRAATPSVAAQIASPNSQEYRQLLTKTAKRLVRCMEHQLNCSKQKLENLSKRCRHPQQRLEDSAQRLDDLSQRLNLTIKTQLQLRQQKVFGLSRTLHAISPLASLERGYAIVTHAYTKKILREINQINVGDKIVAEIAKGKLLCHIVEKIPNP